MDELSENCNKDTENILKPIRAENTTTATK